MAELPPIQLVLGEVGYSVRVDHPGLWEDIRRWSAPLQGQADRVEELSLQTSTADGLPRLERGGEWRCYDCLEDLHPAFEGELFRDLVERHSGGMLHAAAAARGGQAALFLGDSGAGKSVLSLELLSRGWTYLSDEFAPIDAAGRVIAVPRPICFDPEELPAVVWERVTRGRQTLEVRYRRRSGWGRSVYVLPERPAPSGARFPVRALFQLQPVPGGAPRKIRLPGAQSRALLFALSRRAARSVGPDAKLAKAPPA